MVPEGEEPVQRERMLLEQRPCEHDTEPGPSHQSWVRGAVWGKPPLAPQPRRPGSEQQENLVLNSSEAAAPLHTGAWVSPVSRVLSIQGGRAQFGL